VRRTARRLGLPLLVAAALGASAGAQEGNVVLKREGGVTDPPPAVFPHWIHRIRYTCYACHPGPIEPSSKPITHEAMATGQACGACHDGRTAWGIGFATCTRCHLAR
jgi:c(7)-type cytochrome triheme protein